MTILVQCTGNSGRSIPPEALINHDGSGKVEAFVDDPAHIQEPQEDVDPAFGGAFKMLDHRAQKFFELDPVNLPPTRLKEPVLELGNMLP